MNPIEPTLDDDGIMDFVASGFVVLESVVMETYNRCCDGLAAGNCDDLVGSDNFTREVLLHPEVAGVARSLLGVDFRVPRGGHHHFFQEPHLGQTWHSDGLSGRGYDVRELQCYYYPHSVALEDGPTMVLPGSHCRAVDREAIAHYGDILGQVSLVVAAGTVVLTRYGIWHKAGPKINDRPRSMIKFSYHRQATPVRDWHAAEGDPPQYRDRPRFPYVTEVESYRDRVRRMRTWTWLCGLDEEVELRWEQSEPVSKLNHT